MGLFSMAVSDPGLSVKSVLDRMLGSFQRLLPLAAPSNVRLIIVNRRDYSGSSKYSDSDLERLNSGCESFMEQLGLEIAQLLLWITSALKIPKISRDRRSGGKS